MELINVFDFEEAARAKLPAMVFDYYAGGAQDEVTLRANRAAFERIALRYRVLMDVSHRDLVTTVLDQPVAMPILIAPTAFHGLAHPEGEVATARAAAKAGTIMVLSTLSNAPLEGVVRAAPGAVWFQLYVYRDRGATKALVERAEAAGCTALVLTADAPLLGRRERDVRHRFHLPEALVASNVLAAGYGHIAAQASGSGLATYVASLLDASLTWKDLAWLRAITRLPLLVKGIVRSDDAVRAVEHGAAGVIVSNHGGRQLDTAPATLDVLPDIAEAVGDRAAVLLDGGIRRGSDVVKALALGARAVLVGRPILWGLAVDGENGVFRVLSILRDEFDLAMALCGCPGVRDVTRDLV